MNLLWLNKLMNIFIHQLSEKCLLANAYRMSHSRFFTDEQTCSTPLQTFLCSRTRVSDTSYHCHFIFETFNSKGNKSIARHFMQRNTPYHVTVKILPFYHRIIIWTFHCKRNCLLKQKASHSYKNCIAKMLNLKCFNIH